MPTTKELLRTAAALARARETLADRSDRRTPLTDSLYRTVLSDENIEVDQHRLVLVKTVFRNTVTGEVLGNETAVSFDPERIEEAFVQAEMAGLVALVGPLPKRERDGPEPSISATSKLYDLPTSASARRQATAKLRQKKSKTGLAEWQRSFAPILKRMTDEDREAVTAEYEERLQEFSR
jgi:hypothetical protein